jgi:hypothetical protein
MVDVRETPFPVRNGAKINELIPHRVRAGAWPDAQRCTSKSMVSPRDRLPSRPLPNSPSRIRRLVFPPPRGQL